jgi:hypothetical protein
LKQCCNYIDFIGALVAAVAGAAFMAVILARQQAGMPVMLAPAVMPFSHLAAAAAVQLSFLPLAAGLLPSLAKAVEAETNRARASSDFFIKTKVKNEQLELIVTSKVRAFLDIQRLGRATVLHFKSSVYWLRFLFFVLADSQRPRHLLLCPFVALRTSRCWC